MYRWMVLGLLALVGLVALLETNRILHYEQEETNNKRIEKIARQIHSHLSIEIQIPLNSVASMHAFMLSSERLPDFKHFDEFAARMLQNSRTVQGFAYVDKQSIIRHFYPLEGNEEAIDLDLMTRPAAKYVEEAIRSKRMTISPPTVTVQGPLATIARMPLYRDDRFLGLVQAVINIEDTLQLITKDLDEDVKISLEDSKGRIFWGESDYPEQAMPLKVKVGDSVWRARVWLDIHELQNDNNMIYFVWLGGITLLLLLLFIVNRSFTESHLLAAAVRKKTVQLTDSEKRWRSLIEKMKLIGVGLDPNGRVNYVNPYFCEVTGYNKDEVIGHDWFTNYLPEKKYAELQAIYEKLRKGDIVSHYLNPIKTKYGEERDISWFNTRLVDDTGDFSGTFSIGEDITSRRELEKRLDYLAYHDTLTDLPNRTLFIDRLNHAIKRVRRDNTLLALLIFDLDQFKTINDSLGHHTGDLLLQATGHRLRNAVRSDDTVARLGGDEFTILLENIKHIDAVEEVAKKILSEIPRPFEIDRNRLYVSASIGIVIYPISDEDVDDLLRAADTAMYHAKAAGRNCFRFYEAEMAHTAYNHLDIANSLHDALLHDQFSVVFQSIIDLDTDKLTGVETLLRWKHPERGWVSPADFIPIAESTGLIVNIGYWVLREACRFRAVLQKDTNAHITVSVNVSGYQFRDRDFIKNFTTILQNEKTPPEGLIIEITESQLMEDAKVALDVLHKLRELGCRIAIDDFGTGYSSLSYLKLFPVDILKIDRSFLADMVTDKNSMALLKAIQLISDSLNIKLIAEGVETAEQLSILKSLKIEMAQGYFLGKPCPFSELFNTEKE